MKTILLITAAAAAALVAGAARPEPAVGTTAAAGEAGGITVTGSGAVAAVPDRAELSFGVESRGGTARAALAANSAAMQKVVAALRAAGIAAADIQTQHVSISSRTTMEGAEISGYTATNAVSARIRSLDRVAAVIDAAVDAGANQLYGPSLSRSNAAELYRTALARAVEDARAKARALADASGLSLGAVTAVVEAGGGPMPAADLAEESRASAPIEPGTQEIRATVTVTFGAG